MYAVYTREPILARTKIFKSGNASAVRFPASFAAVPGTVVEVREEQGHWVVETVSAEPRKIDLTGIYGARPAIQPIADRSLEERPSETTAHELLEHGDQMLKRIG